MKRKDAQDDPRSNNMDDRYYGMISEDRSAQANLPQEVKMEHYPRNVYLSSDIDDSIKRVDSDDRDAEKEIRNHRSESMY